MWLEAIASDAATHASHAIRSPVRNHHNRQAVDSAENIHSMMYIFPSRLYPSRYAEHADTSAATSATRRRTNCTARKYITGGISEPHNAGSARTTAGVKPVE